MNQEIVGKRRRPVVALLFAVFAGGLGHLYCGKACQAVVWFITLAVLTNVLLALMFHWDAAPYNIIAPLIAVMILAAFYWIHVWRTAKHQPEDFPLKSYNRWYYYLLWLVVANVLGAYAVPIFGSYEGFKSPAQSMEDAVMCGEYIHADMSVYDSEEPRYGDIIVFVWPGDSVTMYKKRCVGLPGDTVEIVDKKLYINGVLAELPSTMKFIDTTATGEQVIQPRRPGGKDSRDNFGPHVVPENQYFVLGDNWDNSYDSRYWGYVPRDMILGKALRIYYSPDWSRIGKRIK